jgi:checkpoint serine/threonine-protein kinase
MELDHKVEEKTEPRAKGFKIHLDEPEVASEPSPKLKQRGFKIFEDVSSEAGPTAKTPKQDEVFVESSSKTLALNDENDENAPPAQPTEAEIRKKMRREERANRTRKIQVMDVKHIKNETKTVQLNLDSPTGQKPKRKKNVDRVAEPTMTINTKEAMDEIYGIFNAPLPSQAGQSEESESEASDSDEDDDDEDDYTTGDESTATGKLSAAPSDYGDETRNELLGQAETGEPEDEHTGWSDFTTSKHVPKDDEDETDNANTGHDSEWELYRDENQQPGLPGDDEEMTTPDEENVRTHSVPIASEDYEPPSAHFRQMTMLPNHRLPFMTPIAEQTESSFGTITGRAQNDYFNTKTPSRQASSAMPDIEDDEDDDTPSSPFQEVTVDLNDDKFKVLQPIRTKSTKGNISLGQGTATSQIEAKTVVPSPPEAVQKGPIVLEQQCNPMDPYLRQTILSQIKPSLQSFKGYHEHSDKASGRTAEIKKYIRSLAKAKNSTSQDKTGQTVSLPPTLKFEDSDATYTIKRELGAGTFAPVYLVDNSEVIRAQEETNDENARSVGKLAYRKPLEAIKMEEPLSAWEFFILQQSHRRLGVSRAAESIVRAHEMHMFRDECFLIEEYRNQGTLLDLVNIARADSASTSGGGMDEVMTMWLTIELFRTIEALHSKQIIHGDLKGDNVLVRFDDPGMETDWSPTYFASGAHGWASKGLCLIDFGRGIDMKQFVPNVAFIADWKTSEADCAEMRELRPWTYQVDYHGMAGIVHSMLFGKYMETLADRQGAALGQGATKTYRIRETLKRYWQVEIWHEVFALLLNPLAHVGSEEGKRMPVLNGMRGLRMKMEGWVEENCERGMGLKGMIARMEGITREKLRRSGRA